MVANIRSGSSLSGALRYNKEKADKNEVANTLLAEDVGTVRPIRAHGCQCLHGEFHSSMISFSEPSTELFIVTLISLRRRILSIR